MRKLIIWALLVMAINHGQAQESSSSTPAKYEEVVREFSPGVLLVKNNLKYGLVDQKTNMLLLPIKYSMIWPPTEGMAMIIYDSTDKQVRGFIDETYSVAIAPKYKCAKPFAEGLAAVCIDNIWGYIDKRGEIKIEMKYRMALPFKNGEAEVMDDKNEVFKINSKGQRL